MAVKKKEHEKLTPGNIRRVAALLEDEKPISKKDACDLLNIAYNTKRLAKIIEDQQSKDEIQNRRRKEKRGTPLTNDEKATIVKCFLDGDSLKDIAEMTARPSSTIKSALGELGVPEIPKGDEKHKPSLLPESCIKYDYKPGEVAWSSIHHKPVHIKQRFDGKYVERYGVPCYLVWVTEDIRRDDDKTFYVHSMSGGYNAYVAGYDLGSLDHLTELGVKLDV